MKKDKKNELHLAASGRIVRSIYTTKKKEWVPAVPLYKPARILKVPKQHEPLEGQLELFLEEGEGCDTSSD